MMQQTADLQSQRKKLHQLQQDIVGQIKVQNSQIKFNIDLISESVLVGNAGEALKQIEHLKSEASNLVKAARKLTEQLEIQQELEQLSHQTTQLGKVQIFEKWPVHCFNAIDTENKGYIVKDEILSLLKARGVLEHHGLQDLIQILGLKKADDKINVQEFSMISKSIKSMIFFKRVLEWDLKVPNFEVIQTTFKKIFDEIQQDTTGKWTSGNIATYIPPLAKADPNTFASSFCSTDGQFFQIGDTGTKFSIQSIGKVVTYAYIHSLIGDDVHQWVGVEPSGVVFNAPVFNAQGKPHNPMVNAGAIMVCGTIVFQGKKLQDILDFYSRATNLQKWEIDVELYKEEDLTGHTNHALKSLMLANNAFPFSNSSAQVAMQQADESLDLYFKCCSILVDVGSLAMFGSMLANNGINPFTGEKILTEETVQSVVTIMNTCGMYNGAGQFSKDNGIPSKSGVSGGLLTVIPGVGSVASLAPKLNNEGNSVKSIGIIQKLNKIFNNFNLFHKAPQKRDMMDIPFATKIQSTIAACEAASQGDLSVLVRLHNAGVKLNQGDYDLRTPLHLASAFGHLEVVKFLVQTGVEINPVDRWQSTPLNDAKTDEVQVFLKSKGGIEGAKMNYQNMSNSDNSILQYTMLYAAAYGDLKLMKCLNIRGFKINGYDYDGRTALGLSCSNGHLDIVKYLITHGADVNLTDARGNDVLADAIRENRKDVIEYLKKIKDMSPSSDI